MFDPVTSNSVVVDVLPTCVMTPGVVLPLPHVIVAENSVAVASGLSLMNVATGTPIKFCPSVPNTGIPVPEPMAAAATIADVVPLTVEPPLSSTEVVTTNGLPTAVA